VRSADIHDQAAGTVASVGCGGSWFCCGGEGAPAAARGRYLAAFQYSFAAASVLAPAFFAGLYAVGDALPFVVLGLVNAASVPVLFRLGRALPQRAVDVSRPGDG